MLRFVVVPIRQEAMAWAITYYMTLFLRRWSRGGYRNVLTRAITYLMNLVPCIEDLAERDTCTVWVKKPWPKPLLTGWPSSGEDEEERSTTLWEKKACPRPLFSGMTLFRRRRGRAEYYCIRQEAITRAITYWMTLFPRRTQVFLYETRSNGSGLYLLDGPFHRKLGQLRYPDTRKEAMTRAITYWMTLFPCFPCKI